MRMIRAWLSKPFVDLRRDLVVRGLEMQATISADEEADVPVPAPQSEKESAGLFINVIDQQGGRQNDCIGGAATG